MMFFSNVCQLITRMGPIHIMFVMQLLMNVCKQCQ